jgi:hypothetical protein
MPPAGLEPEIPASELSQTYALDHSANVIGPFYIYEGKFPLLSTEVLQVMEQPIVLLVLLSLCRVIAGLYSKRVHNSLLQRTVKFTIRLHPVLCKVCNK